MTAKLATLLEELEAAIVAGVNGTRFGLGAKHISDRVEGPRIVWVPGKDEFTAASAQGRRPRAVATRRAAVSAHVYGNDLAQAEDLVHTLVYALHSKWHGSMSVETGEWLSPQWLERGEGCIVRFTVDIPITAPEPVRRTPDLGFDTTGIVQGDGYLDVGES